MTDGETQPVYERGDVVYGADPFKGDDAGRPWLVVSNHADRPFHGEQYLVVTLTTKSWLDGLVEIPDSGWVEGGTPADSRIVPWGVQSLDHDDVAFWQGRVNSAVVERAVAALIEELE